MRTRVLAALLATTTTIVIGCSQGVGGQGSAASLSLAQACSAASAQAAAAVIPPGVDSTGSGGGNGNAGQLLAELGSSDPGARDKAALHILRHAPDYGDTAILSAETILGSLGDFRADPDLVRVLRNSFSSSGRAFGTSARADAALALGASIQDPRGTPTSAAAAAGGSPEGATPLPGYILRSVAAEACPPESPDIRQAVVRALGEFRDAAALPLLQAVAATPQAGDDVQDRLLTLSAERAIVMIQSGSVTPQAISDAEVALGAAKAALPTPTPVPVGTVVHP